MKGLYRLTKSTYITALMPTADSSREERRAHQEQVEKIESLWFLLAQATKDRAALVVQHYERNGHPNGREGWLESKQIYGGREQDERPIQLFTVEGRLRDVLRHSLGEASSYIVLLDGILSVFKLQDVKP